MNNKLIYLGLTLLLQFIGMSFANAQVMYPYMGPVNQVADNFIAIGDYNLKLSPTVKVKLENNIPGKLTDLKKGQLVGATVLVINKNELVDTIYLLKWP